jgi:hypothetical protein
LAILGIFLAGGVAGGFVGARLELRHTQKHTKVEPLSENVMDMLDARLDLSDQQVIDLQPMVDQACDELRRLFQNNHENVSLILDKYYELITPGLNADQAKTLEAMGAELHRKAGELEKSK